MSRVLMLALALLVVAASTASTQSAAPHPEEAAILAIVDRFMLAVADKDPAALNALRLEGGFNIVERPAPKGGTLVARRVFTPPSGNRTVEYRERYWDPDRSRARQHCRGLDAVRVLDRRQDLALRHRRLRDDEGPGRLEDREHDVDGRARCMRRASARRPRPHPPGRLARASGRYHACRP